MDLKDKYIRLIILALATMIACGVVILYSVYVYVNNSIWLAALCGVAGSVVALYVIVDKREKSKLENMVE